MTTENAEIDDLGTAETIAEPITLSWGGLNNDGTVFGCFETEVLVKFRRGDLVSRSADTTAGFIAAGAATWTELDASLPSGSSLYSSVYYNGPTGIQKAACALGVNEFGQVVGCYQMSARFLSEDLWLLDPYDGLFDVNDLVVGDAADVEAFRAAQFHNVHLTGIDADTGYGIISGSASSYGPAFILTPRLIQQP